MIRTTNIPRAYSEVYAFVNSIGERYINKIPKKMYNIITSHRDLTYNPTYKNDITMEETMISKEALALIAAINLKYWVKTEDEKRRLNQIYISNQEKENEKYDYEKLFNKEELDNIYTKEPALPMKYKKPNIFDRMINIIKDWIKKDK